MKNFALIVTYNELENLKVLLPMLFAQDLQVIIVDDQSPDGSPAWLREYAAREPRLHPLIRAGKLGYGTAVLDGFRYALAQGVEQLVTLDADLSHDPEAIPGMLGALQTADVALGSRYVNGCRVLNWQLSRLMVSVFANFYVRTILRLSFGDCTSGFRAYRAEALKRLEMGRINSSGYSILVEVLYQLKIQRMRIVEFPIVYSERREGESKMSKRVILEAIINPFKMLFKYAFRGKSAA
jgi:dolichol-phosphate mannosyltransferase